MQTLICDTRENKWQHVKDFLTNAGIPWLRSKLPVGDYARMDNMTTVIDRKASLSEVENNLVHQHNRFRNECQLAQENGIHLIVLVEEPGIKQLSDVARWKNPRYQTWNYIDKQHSRGKMLNRQISSRPPIQGDVLVKTMQTMAERYGIEWRFCSPDDTGAMICQILGSLPTR